jgi:hypothetical protein
MKQTRRDLVQLNQFAFSFINYKPGKRGYFAIVNTKKQKATALLELIHGEYGIKED